MDPAYSAGPYFFVVVIELMEEFDKIIQIVIRLL
jgi:hypothetical protein